MMKIICFHQSADLYGSDRSFLQVIEYFCRSGKYAKIAVVLPREGPLSSKLLELDVELIYMELSLLSKTYLKKLQFSKILFPLLAFRSKLRLVENFDFVYVNTSVILDFYFLAPFIKKKKFIHIREIPAPWLSKLLTFFIRQSDSTVIFNSYSTQRSFGNFSKQFVVHNAFEGFPKSNPSNENLRQDMPLKLLLIGRINSWKGQDFTISALSKIKNENFLLKIVGSTSTGNEKLLTLLKEEVKIKGLSEKVIFEEFVEDTVCVYLWSDMVVVPSKKPEPFGRIAIEAMSLGKPVIAANHGGLPEIVNDDCGTLVVPNDENSLIQAIQRYLSNRELVDKQGLAARVRFEENFSIKGFYNQLDNVFN